MDRQEVIRVLNLDLADEHGAIIQYLNNAYSMGEGEMACEIEAIAREEMRHLDWLAETIVDLGGVPTLERGKMRLGGAGVPDWMNNDVLLEEGAIRQYREHIEAIDDRRVKRLLERINSDEKAHRLQFQHFIQKAGEEGMHDLRGSRAGKLVETLNWGVEHEYTVVLQYLLHSYLSPGAESKRVLEDQAINEMLHLGWLSEEVVSAGGAPSIEHTPVDASTDPADMLRADIEVEKEVSAAYDRAAGEVEDPDLKRLFRRMQSHEEYHNAVFEDLLASEGRTPD